MIHEYIQSAIKKAKYKTLGDGTWFGEIPGFEGVWANGKSLEDCRQELIDVLEEWLILKLRDGDSIPEVDGHSIKIQPIQAA
ncbi:MAG: hypothetical protein A2W61_05395 [Deltaproteobacteria bacterium RIFCSPLOWO2_01_44_7]|nr:MAG: hypothetical protein A2712_10885 [Deltaproteobacteria bacterium RIFCSPHIGHO2_01_FULL_43_49]OGQ16559.1 MAG: hypothetical protein A3D22_06585 [Deltaproteobacteria bacterium RIFCSPHIGHO2_02_FULL_44_53]OGQ28375.1 MAG: hypothetical protein A3D98_06290 [Deltaproteobacteria bacterium RIFCSPHIGHO2_12_FULL_44_21]OGQ32447.1 MAG: hypothetical protein A2979_10850 [Deltaproteobacteria bacterium RIFCSPLOWO2_01_FULL_45_74]OGQ38119.1 MAG: hypothetical protein A2W61_05395 [Deltaproteobacteria bacterium 